MFVSNANNFFDDNIFKYRRSISSIFCAIHNVIFLSLLYIIYIFFITLNLDINKTISEYLICRICWFPWYQYSYYSWLQTTDMLSLSLKLWRAVTHLYIVLPPSRYNRCSQPQEKIKQSNVENQLGSVEFEYLLPSFLMQCT